MYKALPEGGYLRLADNASIPADPANTDYRRALAEIAAGATVLPPEPTPEPGPSRDERLLAAVDQATAAVQSSTAFTAEQKTILAGVFAGLGQAITGGTP